MVRYLLCVVIAIGWQMTARAQLSSDIYITKDANIETRVGDASIANTNYGAQGVAAAQAWTNSGSHFTKRYIFDADLSGLPAGIEIVSAEIYFFSHGNHSPLSHPNDAYLRAFTGNWSETGITWNNHLDSLTGTPDSVYLPSSDAGGTNITDLDYVVDVTDIISQNFNNNQPVTTFRLKLDDESHWSRLMFRSSDHTDTTSHPFIRIEYNFTSPFAEPQRALDGSFYLCHKGKLNLKVEEKYYANNDTLDIEIYDKSHSLVYAPTSLLVNTGINLYEIDLMATSLFTAEEYYVARIRDTKGNVKLLRFQYDE